MEYTINDWKDVLLLVICIILLCKVSSCLLSKLEGFDDTDTQLEQQFNKSMAEAEFQLYKSSKDPISNTDNNRNLATAAGELSRFIKKNQEVRRKMARKEWDRRVNIENTNLDTAVANTRSATISENRAIILESRKNTELSTANKNLTSANATLAAVPMGAKYKQKRKAAKTAVNAATLAKKSAIAAYSTAQSAVISANVAKVAAQALEIQKRSILNQVMKESNKRMR